MSLNRDLKLKGQTHWHYCIDLSRSEAIASWSKDTQDKGDYKPGNETLRLENKLKPGAYVLEAKAAGNTARDLVLVSDATVVLKTSVKRFAAAGLGRYIFAINFLVYKEYSLT